MWGSNGPTANVYIAKRLSLPVRHTAVVLSDSMARCRSQLERSLPHVNAGPHVIHTTHPHAADTQRVCMDISKSVSSTIRSKPKLQDSPCCPFLSRCVGFVKIFVLCWLVHIAHVSVWCPVDMLLISVGFLLHMGWEGTEGCTGLFSFKTNIQTCSLNLFTLACSLQSQKQIYSLEDEVI